MNVAWVGSHVRNTDDEDDDDDDDDNGDYR